MQKLRPMRSCTRCTTLWSVARQGNIKARTSMTIEEIIALNKKSAERDEAYNALHAHDYCDEVHACKPCRDWRMAQQPPRRHYTFIGEQERQYEALTEIDRDNVRAAIAD